MTRVSVTLELVREAMASWEARRKQYPKRMGTDPSAYVTGYLQAALKVGEERWTK